MTWTPDIWQNYPARQQPSWPDLSVLNQVLSELRGFPPLVFAGEIRKLKQHFADASQGKCFIVQGGDCAETFDEFSADAIRDKLKILLQMSVILSYSTSRKVVKIGRIAGQFAKPRSLDFEVRQGHKLPIYRGDAVNDIASTPEARTPDPHRLTRAYHQSASTLNLLRAFTTGGFADLQQVHLWNQEFIAQSRIGLRYESLAKKIDDAVRFARAWGMSSNDHPASKLTEFYTSHEGLLLGYESALTRVDSQTGDWYDCSAHMLWIGNRTRQSGGAHARFFAGVKNPVGIKIGPDADLDDLSVLLDLLNPGKEQGRLVLITRIGNMSIQDQLPNLIRMVRKSRQPVTWLCDPMHGNTYLTDGGVKTRSFQTILSELEQFFRIHSECGSVPGGVHFELTGANVTECVGGAQEISHLDLKDRYESACDPRLNCEQSLELAFHLSELLHTCCQSIPAADQSVSGTIS